MDRTLGGIPSRGNFYRVRRLCTDEPMEQWCAGVSCRRGRSISSRDVHRHEAGETHSNYHADAVPLVFLGHSLVGRRRALLRSYRSTNLEEFSSNKCTLTTVTRPNEQDLNL